jgi:hypothetical protein
LAPPASIAPVPRLATPPTAVLPIAVLPVATPPRCRSACGDIARRSATGGCRRNRRGERAVLERERRRHRQQHGQPRSLTTHLNLKRAATLALRDVMAQLAATPRAAAQNRELLANWFAVSLACQPTTHERPRA